MTIPTQPGDEMAAMPSEEMIEAGYRALVACKPMTSTDCEREACEAIYTAMRALAKPVAAMPSEEMIEAGMGELPFFDGETRRDAVVAIYTAMRALAKPDDGAVSGRLVLKLKRIAASQDMPGSQRNLMMQPSDAHAILRALAKPDDGVVEALKLLRLFADYAPEWQTQGVMSNLQRKAKRVLASLATGDEQETK